MTPLPTSGESRLIRRLALAAAVVRGTGRTLSGLALEAAGAVSIVVGVAQFSPRVAWIVGGLLAVGLAFVMGDDA